MGLGGWFKISFVRTWTKTLSLLKLIFPSAFFDSREIFPLRNCLPALNLCLKTGGKRSKLSIWNMCLNNWDRVFCIQPVCFSTSLPLILFTRLHPPQHPAHIPGGDPQKILENIWKYCLPGCNHPNILQTYLVIILKIYLKIYENIWKYFSTVRCWKCFIHIVIIQTYSHLPNKRATRLLTFQLFIPPTRPY